ncbi:ankyrin repeat domain-containing protein 50-like [Mytilus californianus]|uniref:ankyrin repeat domain-containing protein 50-like n=1 Tax=Mytilus californianus TaxID=6549 RepID=UPI002247C9AE|nr:ankyrin repeat domain-containing protein 50-like [Mytilus californianus]
MVFGSEITEQSSLLILGAYCGNDEMMKLILKYVNGDCINKTPLTTNINCLYNEHRTHTPLTAACYSSHLSVVHLLHKNNAQINLCDDYPHFPLELASSKGHDDIVQYLVQNGANVNQCDEFSRSSLHRASANGHYGVVKYLVENGAIVNHCDKYNRSTLHRALEVGHNDIIEYLIRNGADVNLCDRVKKTPLFEAAEIGNIDIVKYLIKNNADFTIGTDNNISPLHIAVWLNNSEIVKELIKAENDKIPLSGNYHLLHILFDIIKSNNCFDDRPWNDRSVTKKKHNLSKGLLNFIRWERSFLLIKLLKLGHNVNYCDCKGQLLFKMIEDQSVMERVQKVDLLILNGADITARDDKCMSLLEQTRRMINNRKRKGRGCDSYQNIMLILKQRVRRFSV